MRCQFGVVFAPLPEEMRAEWHAAIETLAMWMDETPFPQKACGTFPAFPQIAAEERGDLGEGADGQIADDNSGAAGEAGRSPSGKG
jgi:hypothetical protein